MSVTDIITIATVSVKHVDILRFSRQLYFDQNCMTEDDLEQITPMT